MSWQQMEAEPLSDLTPFEPSWNVAPQMHVPVATEVGVQGEEQRAASFSLDAMGVPSVLGQTLQA